MRCLIAVILLLISTVTTGQNADYIEWNKNRPLKWADFAATVDKSIPFDAITISGPVYSFQYHRLGDNKYQLLFNIVCRFYKNRSWSVIDEQNAAVLAHEQTHFDISEFFTRQLDAALNDAEYTKNYREETAKIYDDIIVKLSVMQHTFDFQTGHSKNIDKENEWEIFVAKILDKSYTLQKALDKMPKS